MSMGGANTDLSVTLSEVKNMRTAAKAFMNAQNLGESYNLLICSENMAEDHGLVAAGAYQNLTICINYKINISKINIGHLGL